MGDREGPTSTSRSSLRDKNSRAVMGQGTQEKPRIWGHGKSVEFEGSAGHMHQMWKFRTGAQEKEGLMSSTGHPHLQDSESH